MANQKIVRRVAGPAFMDDLPKDVRATTIIGCQMEVDHRILPDYGNRSGYVQRYQDYINAFYALKATRDFSYYCSAVYPTSGPERGASNLTKLAEDFGYLQSEISAFYA